MAHCMTSHPKSEIPPDVARNTRSVLLSSMKGVLLKRFCRDYKSLVGEEFPWRKLGFPSATSLLQAMTDVARFEFSKKDGDYKVYGIADGMVYTPSWFVKAQGNVAKKSTPPPPLPVRGTKGVELIYNARGLVTVYVTWFNSASGKRESLNHAALIEKKDMLRRMMQKVGEPIEVYVSEMAYGFVRFETIEEAQNAIEMYNKSVINGLMFHVKPAAEATPQGKIKPNMIRQQQKAKRREKQTGEQIQKQSEKLAGKPVRKQVGNKRIAKQTPQQRHYSHLNPRHSADGGNGKVVKPPLKQLSHPQSEKRLYDQVRRLHKQERSHDQEGQSHDQERRSHDQERRSHDQERRSNDQERRSNDEEKGTDTVRASRYLLHNQETDFQSVSDISSTSESSWDDELLVIPIPSHTALHFSNTVNFQSVAADMHHVTVATEWSDSGSVRSDKWRNTFDRVLQGDALDGAPVRDLESCDVQCPWQLSELSTRNESGLIPVRVSEVMSPDQVWLQLCQDPEGDLEKLSLHITALGTERLTEVCVGDVCCTRLPDSHQYRRVMVEEVKRQASHVHDQVKLLWVDTGSTHHLPLSHLFSLPPHLSISEIPPLSIPAQLGAVVSTHGDGQNWFPLDNQLLWKHIHHKTVYAKFVQRPSPPSGSVSSHQPGYNHGNRPGVVDLYFDPEGLERVADTFVREGYHVEYDEILPNGTLKEMSEDGLQSNGHFTSKCDDYHRTVHPTSASCEGSVSSEEAAVHITEKFSPWKRMQQAYKHLVISNSSKSS